MMTDAKTLAYINMYAVLGTLENLCELDKEASELVKTKKPVSIGLEVKGGPSATLTFLNGRCRMEQGTADCDFLLPFSTPEKFNAMVDGTGSALPSKGFSKVFFLLKKFIPLTDILSKYLRPTEEDLKDDKFFEISTKLMFYVITVALSQIGNNDEIGKFSASLIPDGIIDVSIKDCVSATIQVKDSHMITIKEKPEAFRSQMQFCDIRTARALFDGKINAIASIGEGKVEMHGLINMIDNVNRILDRVALYLA
ncbi:MAG: hypothetical protein IJN88_08505 [Clostridia bacterium]|nr:hypothetical protein [Clostridia bacterium]